MKGGDKKSGGSSKSGAGGGSGKHKVKKQSAAEIEAEMKRMKEQSKRFQGRRHSAALTTTYFSYQPLWFKVLRDI